MWGDNYYKIDRTREIDRNNLSGFLHKTYKNYVKNIFIYRNFNKNIM